MTYTKLEHKPLEELTRDEENNFLLESEQRIMTFRAKIFQDFADRLLVSAGSSLSYTLLYNMGLAIGRRGMVYSRDAKHSDNDLCLVMDRAIQIHGWGRCVGMERTNEGNETVLRVRWKNTPLSYGRQSKEPTCHMMLGICVGWLEDYFGRQAAHSSEIACASTGNAFCTFEIRFEVLKPC